VRTLRKRAAAKSVGISQLLKVIIGPQAELLLQFRPRGFGLL
jgi:hypothetical protein